MEIVQYIFYSKNFLSLCEYEEVFTEELNSSTSPKKPFEVKIVYLLGVPYIDLKGEWHQDYTLKIELYYEKNKE